MRILVLGGFVLCSRNFTCMVCYIIRVFFNCGAVVALLNCVRIRMIVRVYFLWKNFGFSRLSLFIFLRIGR